MDVNRTEEQLNDALKKSKGGKMGGKLLALAGVAVALVGVILGGNYVLIIIGGVVLAVGEAMQGKARSKASRQAFDAMAPALIGDTLENADFSPAEHILRTEDCSIPLPSHTYCGENGYIRGLYKGLPTELCTVVLTDVDEVQREETGLWERNERVVYTGQWMACETGKILTKGMTIWPRNKLLNGRTIKTDNEAFNKRFNLSCDDEEFVLRFLSQSRMERFMALADSAFSPFAVCLRDDGRLYIAAHSGRGFFDVGKGREDPAQLRQRFAGELKWFTDVIDTFRPV